MQQVIYAGGKLYAAMSTTLLKPSGGFRNGVAWFVITPGQAIAPLTAEAKVPLVLSNAAGSAITRISPYVARVSFTLKEPGVYLLRVQTANTKSDHEHFSAIDLQAE